MALVVSATWAKVPFTLVGLCGFAGSVALATGIEALDYRVGFMLSALSAAAIVTGLALVTARFATTGVLAALSYYLIECPIVEGVLWRTLKAPAGGAGHGGDRGRHRGRDGDAGGRRRQHVIRQTHPVGERQALQTAHAFTTRPVRFMFVGDSLSVTMGVGLEVDTVHRWGVDVINKGSPGL